MKDKAKREEDWQTRTFGIWTSDYRCLKFYKMFPEIVASVRQQSRAILSWTHYRVLLQVEDKAARDWYEKEADKVSVRIAHG